MKRKLIYFLLICTLLILSGCSNTSSEPLSTTESNDLFTLTIHTDSNEYSKETPVECYATLKYIGDEPITIYHSDPLTVFMIEDDKYFEGGGTRNDVLVSTTFEPDDEVRLDFQKSGGWSADDPNASFYEDFYHEKDLLLPKGEYTLSVNIDYSLDDHNMVDTRKSLSASIEIVVK